MRGNSIPVSTLHTAVGVAAGAQHGIGLFGDSYKKGQQNGTELLQRASFGCQTFIVYCALGEESNQFWFFFSFGFDHICSEAWGKGTNFPRALVHSSAERAPSKCTGRGG